MKNPRKIARPQRRSTQIQKTVFPIKSTMKSSHTAKSENHKASKVLHKNTKSKVKQRPNTKQQADSKPAVADLKPTVADSKPSVLVSNRTKKALPDLPKKRYVSGTDSDDDRCSTSGSESSTEEFMNVNENKLKWKDGVKCPNCSYIAHSSLRLEQHVSSIHARNVTYKCKVCDFTCKWNREYYLHMKTHFEGPPFHCENCDYVCERIQFLLSHRMRHTDERPYKCSECDHRCRTKANLDCHMRCHTGEKPYQCPTCERRFAIKASLDQHLATHRDDRPYLCDTCGFTTKYHSHLFSHKRIHTGDVFRCSFPGCEYSTPKKSQLNSHQRTHSAVRSHLCSICGRAFIEKSHLVRHERIHLNEKPFKCEHCDYCSSRRDKLKEHFNKHHGENPTAKAPYRPRKQRKQASFSNRAVVKTESENSLSYQHGMELHTVDGDNQTPIVFNYEPSHEETLQNKSVAWHPFEMSPLKNLEVAFMEPAHQPYPSPPSAHVQLGSILPPGMLQDHNHCHTFAGPILNSSVPIMMGDVNYNYPYNLHIGSTLPSSVPAGQNDTFLQNPQLDSHPSVSSSIGDQNLNSLTVHSKVSALLDEENDETTAPSPMMLMMPLL